MQCLFGGLWEAFSESALGEILGDLLLLIMYLVGIVIVLIILPFAFLGDYVKRLRESCGKRKLDTSN